MNHQPHTDDTVLDLPTVDPTRTLAASDAPRRRTRRLVAGAVALALAAAGIGVLAAGGGSSSTQAAPAQGVSGLVGETVDATVPPAAEPQPDPQAPGLDEAQPEPPAAPGVLAVNTSVIMLMEGDYDGSFTVRNDGGSPIDWSFHGGIWAIGVSQSGGTLAPGASTVVSFTINPFQLADGPFVFVNHVVGGGFDKAITIQGVKTPIVVNPNIPQGPQNIKP
jgi:hypothetical protein